MNDATDQTRSANSFRMRKCADQNRQNKGMPDEKSQRGHGEVPSGRTTAGTDSRNTILPRSAITQVLTNRGRSMYAGKDSADDKSAKQGTRNQYSHTNDSVYETP